MATLRDAGLAEDTIVIFTSDHGDMMGERGLYYKKTFFEWSMRVPLIFWAPKRFAPRRVAAPVSLVDLLATLQDLSGGDPYEILETDGRSLAGALQGKDAPAGPVAGEFLAEGVFEPVFMLRDETHKFLYSETDPPLLFDMTEDPDELTDLSGDSSQEARLSRFAELAAGLWNGAEIKKRIIADQNRRRLVERAHGIGRRPVWDYQPFTDASQQWVRAGKWTVEVEGKAHLKVQ